MSERIGLDYLTKARSLSPAAGEEKLSGPGEDLWGDAAGKIFSWLTSQSKSRVTVAEIPTESIRVNAKAVGPALRYLSDKKLVRLVGDNEVELMG